MCTNDVDVACKRCIGAVTAMLECAWWNIWSCICKGLCGAVMGGLRGCAWIGCVGILPSATRGNEVFVRVHRSVDTSRLVGESWRAPCFRSCAQRNARILGETRAGSGSELLSIVLPMPFVSACACYFAGFIAIPIAITCDAITLGT